MKGIKIILPIVGVFLVIYIASVFMNAVKVNGAISQLNKQYNDEFTMVYSEMGNVFFDADYLMSVKSNKENIIYEFDYSDEKISGNYEAERINGHFNQYIEQNINAEFIALSNLQNAKADITFNIDTLTFDEGSLVILSEEDVSASVNEWLAQHDELKITAKFYVGSKESMKRFKEEVLPIKQRSLIDEKIINGYGFKE